LQLAVSRLLPPCAPRCGRGGGSGSEAAAVVRHSGSQVVVTCAAHTRASQLVGGMCVRGMGVVETSPLSTAFSSPPSLRMKYESTCTPTRGGASKSPWESDPSDP